MRFDWSTQLSVDADEDVTEDVERIDASELRLHITRHRHPHKLCREGRRLLWKRTIVERRIDSVCWNSV